MAEYDNTNSGTLFKNDKGSNPARPDYTGEIDVEGKKYRLAAWIKESQKTGNKFLSLRLTEPAQQEQPAVTEDAKPEVDEELPF